MPAVDPPASIQTGPPRPGTRQRCTIVIPLPDSTTPAARPVEAVVARAAALLGQASTPVEGTQRLKEFDPFPAPIYATDRDGKLIYYNAACVAFSGRTPVVGRDHWCVSWKLEQDDGTPIDHDQCPMAVAVREARPVRDTVAVARRPDGDAKRFIPFPTPAVDAEGRLVGAINLLMPTDNSVCQTLTATAAKCRHLAQWVDDERTRLSLTAMAGECERQAIDLRLD